MEKFAEGFMLGAATAAHQVEGNNIYNDYWVQEQVPHSTLFCRMVQDPAGKGCLE